MPSFASGLVNAASAGLSGAMQGQVESTRALLAERARREISARAAAAQELATRAESHREEQDRIRNLTLGYTPASTSVQLEQPPADAGPTPVSFGDALEGGLGPFAPASKAEAGASIDRAPSLMKPLDPNALGVIPKVRVVNTPESYDPLKSASAAAIELRGNQARVTAADQHTARLAEIALRESGQDRRNAASNSTRIRAAEISANARSSGGGAGGGGGRPMTETAKEAAKAKMLDGWMQYHGTEPALRQYISESDVARGAIQRLGITDADITAAVGRATGRGVNSAVRLDQYDPAGGAARMDTARTAIVARVQSPKTKPTTPRAGTEAPPRVPSAPAAPTRSAPTANSAQEKLMYDRAVQAITATYTGTERDRRLKAAKDRYNARIAGLTGTP